MGRFVEGEDRSQSTLLPERLDDYVIEDNPVRVVDAQHHLIVDHQVTNVGHDRSQLAQMAQRARTEMQ
ncbi:transposase, IS4, partial [mine drainage metagenome]